MAVVRADDQVVVAGVLQNLVEIVIGLASHVDAILLQNILRERPAAPGKAARQVMHRVGNPLRADLDDADLELGEALRDAVKDVGMKRADDRQFEF